MPEEVEHPKKGIKIIFLDIDGVLNHQVWFSSEESRKKMKNHGRFFSPFTMGILNDLVKDTGAKVVVSSTWRKGRSVEELSLLLKNNGFEGEVIGKTPSLCYDQGEYNRSVPRGCEIKGWLDLYKEKHPVENYIILDDDSDMLLWQREHFFQTDTYSGLTPNIGYRATRFLNGIRW